MLVFSVQVSPGHAWAYQGGGVRPPEGVLPGGSGVPRGIRQGSPDTPQGTLREHGQSGSRYICSLLHCRKKQACNKTDSMCFGWALIKQLFGGVWPVPGLVEFL